MKFVKLLIFFLISASSYGQYQNIATPTKWTKGGFDSLFIPARDTTKPGDVTKAWIVLKGAVLYTWNGTKWQATSGAGGGTGGSDYVLPIMSSSVLGGAKVGNDLQIDGSGVLNVNNSRKTLWDKAALLQLYYMTGDSTQNAIHDSLAAHPPYEFNTADFYIQDNTVYALTRVTGETDPLYNASVWAPLPPTKPAEWDEKVSQEALDDTAAAIRNSIKSDSVVFNGFQFSGRGTLASPISLKDTAGGGSTFPYNNNPNDYVGGDNALHPLPTFPNPNDSIDYSFTSMTTIYNEAGPGEYSVTGNGIVANRDNTTNPFRQLKAVDIGGWTDGDYISFTNGTTANSTAYTFLRGFFRLKTAVSIPDYISFAFYNNGTLVSNIVSVVNYGLNKSKVGVYQNISIPMSAFGFTSNSFNELRMIFGGTNGSGLYVDLLQFQNASAIENTFVTDVFRQPGTKNVYKVVGGTNVLAYTDSVGTGGGSGTGWNLGGNTITNSVVNYLGTNNNTSLRLKVNGVEQARLDSSNNYMYLNKGLFIGAGEVIRANTASNGQLYIDASNALTGTIYLRASSVEYSGASLADIGNISGAGTINMGNLGQGSGYSLVSNGVLNVKSSGDMLRFNDNSVYTKVGMRGANYQFNDANTSSTTWTFNNSALLDIQSSTKGVLLPRMTKAQRDAIATPSQGLEVFVTDNGGYKSYYNGGWFKVTATAD